MFFDWYYISIQGRNGKGSIYVWSSGNGGRFDSCAFKGFCNNIDVIAVAGKYSASFLLLQEGTLDP